MAGSQSLTSIPSTTVMVEASALASARWKAKAPQTRVSPAAIQRDISFMLGSSLCSRRHTGCRSCAVSSMHRPAGDTLLRIGGNRGRRELHPGPAFSTLLEKQTVFQCHTDATPLSAPLPPPSRSEVTAYMKMPSGSEWLTPLLEPRSIAIVGASERQGSFGRSTL